jgi:hypothetical protein
MSNHEGYPSIKILDNVTDISRLRDNSRSLSIIICYNEDECRIMLNNIVKTYNHLIIKVFNATNKIILDTIGEIRLLTCYNVEKYTVGLCNFNIFITSRSFIKLDDCKLTMISLRGL